MDDLRDALATTLRDRVGWPTGTVAQIARYAHMVPYEKGATIFRAGQSTDLLHVLLSGDVRLYYGAVGGERLLVSFVRSGEIFGATNFHAPDAHREQGQQVFTAETRSRSKVAIVEQARVAHLLHALPGPELARIVQRIDSRWMALSCRLLTLLTQDVGTRLAYAIGEIVNAFGIPDARGQLLPLRLSHEDFAELVGASRPTVSKQLKQMAQRGIFTKVDGRYILAQADTLAAMSPGNSASPAAQRFPGLKPSKTPHLPMPSLSGRKYVCELMKQPT